MTIKKRLILCNVIMILIPVMTTLVVGAVSVAVTYSVVSNSEGIGFDSRSDFYATSQLVSAEMYEIFEHDAEVTTDRLNVICNVLSDESMYVEVYRDGQMFYTYGNGDISRSDFITSVQAIGNNAFVSDEGCQLYHYIYDGAGGHYDMYLFSEVAPSANFHTYIVTAIISGVIILAAVLTSISIADKFLSRFVLRRMIEPIEQLTDGVREIYNGNLDYRVEYDKKDEFLPVCNAFNDMAIRLKQSVEMSRKNEENRKELLLDISHDLRSPLTSIQAYVEGLLDGVAATPERQRKYLETIKRKTIDIEKMVSALFAYSKLEMDETEVIIEEKDVTGYLRSSVGIIAEEYREKGLEISLPEDSGTVAKFDENLLFRIVVNLLDNSVKYWKNQTGNSRITVTEYGNKVKISFADDGIGVEEENLPKLFNIFYRTDEARSNTGSGNGIGLAFVKKAAESMNGTASAERNSYGGLTITITLEK